MNENTVQFDLRIKVQSFKIPVGHHYPCFSGASFLKQGAEYLVESHNDGWAIESL